jgi:Uncharacterized protein conserved in bacteria
MTRCLVEVRPRAVRADELLRWFAAFLPRLLSIALLTLAWVALAGLSALAVVHAADLRSWPFELVHHFVPSYALGAAILLLLALSVRRLALTLGAALTFAFFIWSWVMPVGAAPTSSPRIQAANGPLLAAGSLPSLPVLPALPVTGPGGTDAPPSAWNDPDPRRRPLTVITNNVFCGNWDADGLLQWIRSRPADVMVMQEVPKYLFKDLAGLSRAYPYQAHIAPDRNQGAGTIGACQGTVLLSTYPITSAARFQPIRDAWPAMIANIEVDGATRVSLAIVHALDPVEPGGLHRRDRFLDQLASLLNSLRGPLVVLGDFNASPFTPAFRAFQEQAGLAPSPWTPATYPARFGTFGISIDHVLVRDATLLRLAPLRAIGSDHRPLSASIALTSPGRDRSPGLAGNAIESIAGQPTARAGRS